MSPSSRRVVRHFEDEWTDYDRRIRAVIPFYDQAFDTVVSVVGAGRDAPRRILDLGVGTGNLAERLLESFPHAHLLGIDLVRRFVDLAEERLSRHGARFELRVADVVDCAHEPEQYDLVVTSFVFHHLSDDDKRRLYTRIQESLCPGGLFLNVDFVDSASPFWSGAFDALRIRHLRDAGWSEREIHTFHTEHRALETPAPMETQISWLGDAGFVDIECFWKYLNLATFGGRREL